MMMMMMMIASYPACPPTPGCAGCHRWIHKPSSWRRCLKFLQTPATHQEQSRATWITETHCTRAINNYGKAAVHCSGTRRLQKISSTKAANFRTSSALNTARWSWPDKSVTTTHHHRNTAVITVSERMLAELVPTSRQTFSHPSVWHEIVTSPIIMIPASLAFSSLLSILYNIHHYVFFLSGTFCKNKPRCL